MGQKLLVTVYGHCDTYYGCCCHMAASLKGRGGGVPQTEVLKISELMRVILVESILAFFH